MQTQVMKAELQLGVCSTAPVPTFDRPWADGFPQRFPFQKGEVHKGLRGRPCWRGALGRKPLLRVTDVGKVGVLGTVAARLQGKEGLSWHEGVSNKCNEMTPALFTGKNTLVWRVREVKASCEIRLWFWESFFEDVLLLLLCGSSWSFKEVEFCLIAKEAVVVSPSSNLCWAQWAISA